MDRSPQCDQLPNTKNAEALLKNLGGVEERFPKSDIRHWYKSVFRRRYRHNEGPRYVGHYSVQLSFRHRREEFALLTANKSAAAARAKEIFEFLRANGWEATIAKFKSTPKIEDPSAVNTVGDFIEAVQATTTSTRSRTLPEYVRSFRRIVANAFGIDDAGKYDYRKNGRARWLERVHAIELTRITPQRIQAWKIDFLARAGQSPVKQRSARISVNSALRGARSLFSSRRTKFVNLPTGFVSPFASVPLEPRQSMRYRGGFDLEAVVRAALGELTASDPEALKIILLAATCGLRRAEIDCLGWEAFDFVKQALHINPSDHFQPKSEDSIGAIDLEESVAKFFERLKVEATGPFVIESPLKPKANATYASYRAEAVFERVTRWLRRHGVRGQKPLHQLRKEFGSLICERYGIFASSRMLRHSDVAITAQYYVDKKARTVIGLAHLFGSPEPGPATEPSPKA
jgi:integrase